MLAVGVVVRAVWRVWDSAGKETDVRKWVAESHELATSFAYDPTILQAVRETPASADLAPMTLDDAYRKAAGEHTRRRVVATGVRLGVVLGGRPTRSVLAPPIQRENLVELTHWLNTTTNVRHNSSCRWYTNTSHGRQCAAGEGEPC